MILEIHDKEVGNTLTGRINDIEYDYQAEQWVQDFTRNVSMEELDRDRYILMDSLGQRAVWQVHENGDVELAEKSDRFTGTWQLNLRFPKMVK